MRFKLYYSMYVTFSKEHQQLCQVPVSHATRIEMSDCPLLQLRIGIALCQTDFILSIVQPAKGETGAGLLVGEKVVLVVVAPADTVVARNHPDLFCPVLSHLVCDKVLFWEILESIVFCVLRVDVRYICVPRSLIS